MEILWPEHMGGGVSYLSWLSSGFLFASCLFSSWVRISFHGISKRLITLLQQQIVVISQRRMHKKWCFFQPHYPLSFSRTNKTSTPAPAVIGCDGQLVVEGWIVPVDRSTDRHAAKLRLYIHRHRAWRWESLFSHPVDVLCLFHAYFSFSYPLLYISIDFYLDDH